MSKAITTQATNKLNLVGKLLNVQFGSGTLSDGRPYKRANVVIRTTQTYNNQNETSEVPISIFATEHTSTGKANPAWASLKELETMKSVQDFGLEKADRIRLTGASLQENYFISRTGQLIDGWQIRGSFVNRAQDTMMDAASFIVEIFIMSMDEEINRDGDVTGRLKIKGGVVQYGGKLDVVEFFVENPDTIDYITRNWAINKTVTVKGRIRVTSEEVAPSGESSGWGEDVPEGPTTQFVRELIITTGDDEPKEDEFAYDENDIKKAFIERKAAIEQKQIDARKKASTNTSAANAPETTTHKYDWE
jgi:hypothetical protein